MQKPITTLSSLGFFPIHLHSSNLKHFDLLSKSDHLQLSQALWQSSRLGLAEAKLLKQQPVVFPH